jgi:peroxiredoxin
MTLEQLPDDLPVPIDDGAADHLYGMHVPSIALQATTGTSVDLSEAGAPWAVVYVYPRTGRPDQELPEGWELIPGARGCTPQTCSFRDHAADFAALGAEVYGLSVQDTDYQKEMVERLRVGFPVLSDNLMEFGRALRLPTMEAAGMTLYKRLTLVLRHGRVEHVMYPVFPPDENAAEALAWIRARLATKTDPGATWNERYARATALFGDEPNQVVAEELSGLAPRRVLDLGCGQGRNSVWLASQGHEVTGLDLSEVGIAHARQLAAAAGLDITFEVVDVVDDWQPRGQYDLVLLSYIQLPERSRRIVHERAVAALAPGGILLLVAHHLDNLTQGVGGPPMAEALFTQDDLAEDFADLDIERNEKVRRDVERDGVTKTAHDVVLRAVKRN